MSNPEGPSVLQQLLQRVEFINSQQGFMAWAPERLALARRRSRPRYPDADRPTRVAATVHLIRMVPRPDARHLRDGPLGRRLRRLPLRPRLRHRLRSRPPQLPQGSELASPAPAHERLQLLRSDHLRRIHRADRVTARGGSGRNRVESRPPCLPEWLTMIGIWHSGAPLPQPLAEANTVDIRADLLPGAPDRGDLPRSTDRRPRGTAPARLRAAAGPAGWPKYRPYD